MKFIALILTLVSFNTYAGVCCNPGGQQVPTMSLCQGSPNVNGSPCCNRAGNQPGGNSQQPITWSTSNSCGEGQNDSAQNCCVNLPSQGVEADCQALGAQLLAQNSLAYTDVVNRCNQIWQGQSCQWKCNGGNNNGPSNKRKILKKRSK